MIRLTRLCWSILALLCLAACAKFVASTDSEFNEVVYKGNATTGEVLFSHNINGETQPCGCRKFPLGGLEQAAGHFHLERQKGPVIYVDTGDLFFPSPVIPENVLESHRFTANALIDAMNKLGLNYFVPGDQDFALGLGWLEQVSHKSSFTFLMANLKTGTQFKSRAWARAKVGQKTILFIGVLDPELLSTEIAFHFENPEDGIKRALQDASPASDELVILLSHAGMDTDKEYAKKFPRLNWVIGAHSQGYTTRPAEEGATQLVQVLSRNHFIGKLQFGLGEHDKQTHFSLLETREEMAQAVTPNPMSTLMNDWRAGLKKTQEEEQRKAAGNLAPDPLPTFNSCVDCHKPQTAFWQKTSHSLAWQTLVAKGSDNDPSCVGCHSLGWQHPQGFSATPQRVRFSNETNEAKLSAYTAALAKSLHGVSTPRKLASAERFKRSGAWMRDIEKHEVTHEYGNVQCVNCHDKNRDHPFSGPGTKEGRAQMVSKCLNCHTNDQSPDWYHQNSKGQADKPNDKIIAQKFKAVSCPVK